MKNDGRRKIMPFLLTFILILSVMVIVPQSSVADEFIGVYPDGINWKVGALTCGDELTYKVTDRSLDPETDYILQLDNGTDWIELEDGESTEDGDLYIEFNAPGWADLDPDYNVVPTSQPWDLRLWNDDTDALEAGYESEIQLKFASINKNILSKDNSHSQNLCLSCSITTKYRNPSINI